MGRFLKDDTLGFSLRITFLVVLMVGLFLLGVRR